MSFPLKAVLASAITVALLSAVAPIACAGAGAANDALRAGEQVQFDGTYYDYRAGDGRAMIKVWVPPSGVVRGLFVSGHGGHRGDSRAFTRDENMKALAARFGFGLAGLHAFAGQQAYRSGGETLLRALRAFAAVGKHRELANVPFLAFGSSNGGATAYGLANHAPERTLCFASNVSSQFNPPRPAADVLKVPAIFFVGRFDPFSANQRGVDAVMELIADARARGGRWSAIVENKGHQDGVAFDVYMKFAEQCIVARYPADANPRRGPVQLRELHEDQGYLADPSTWDRDLTTIAPFRAYEGDRARAHWLLNRDMAFVYRAAATRDSRLAIGVRDVSRTDNPNTDPATMFSIGGPVVEPGRSLYLVADVRDLPDWSSIEFYDGARKLGVVSAPDAPFMDVKPTLDQTVACVTALVYTKSGTIHVAPPFYFAVKDPAVDLRSEAEKTEPPAWRLPPAEGSKTARAVAVGYEPEAGAVAKHVLVAYGLTAADERAFDTQAGQAAPFWSRISEAHDAIHMNQYTHAGKGSTFSRVTSVDARMQVKAAHSKRGLYLFFKVTDDRFLPVESDPWQYPFTDAIDVLFDSVSSATINDPANRIWFMNPGWSLYRSTKQIQVAFGRHRLPTFLKRSFADPWDMTYRVTSMSGARKYHGIIIRFVRVDPRTRVQEWFLPWSEIGSLGELTEEPAVGVRLAFAASYNDTDDSRAGVKRLLWVDNTSPWRSSAADGEAPRGWGDIEIGPFLD